MKLLLDTPLLGKLCHPATSKNDGLSQWAEAILESGRASIILPEICDYELRRKLIHLIAKQQSSPKSVARLDELGELFDYLPLDTEMMRKAADLWAEARIRGLPTAHPDAVDGDIILAAQACVIQGVVVTPNTKHLGRFVTAKDWTSFLTRRAFFCVAGDADNYMWERPECFVLRDEHGRSWFCQPVPFDRERLKAELDHHLAMIPELQTALLKTGLVETGGTTLAFVLISDFLPMTEAEVLDSLRSSLSEKGTP